MIESSTCRTTRRGSGTGSHPRQLVAAKARSDGLIEPHVNYIQAHCETSTTKSPSMVRNRIPLSLCIAVLICTECLPASGQTTRDTSIEAMHRAVHFFREHCSASGGYVFRISNDLKLREGESKVGQSTAWIEPPATPAVGAAYLTAFQLTRDPLLLDAAKETAQALISGQLLSGGWYEHIEFDAEARKLYAYRVDGNEVGKRRNVTTFDDNKTQSSIRFLMRLDMELKQSDTAIHEAVMYALENVLRAQYANGAWPQKYEGIEQASAPGKVRASYPESWPREFPNIKYTHFYTLNDNTLCDLISVQLDAWDAYRDPRYFNSAKLAGEFLLNAQMPEPQPGWAQQYDEAMRPVWARKFEPPAISGGESQRVLRSLLELYERTADRRFLTAVQTALPYFRRSLLPDGRLARFYELQSNLPLFFTKTYELTYSDSDLPTHYGFKVTSMLDRIDRDLKELSQRPTDRLIPMPPSTDRKVKLTDKLTAEAESIIAALDSRGAWVESGMMRTYDNPRDSKIISSATFIKNLQTLAEFIHDVSTTN